MEWKPVAPDQYTEQLADLAGFIHRACAFTGHRPAKFPWKYDETDSRCIALKSALAEQIRLLANVGVTQFLSGMAEATDTWSALSVLALREENPVLKLHCILPCREQADKWTASSRDLYRSILEHASFPLAVYNGERRGGTAATMRYARKLDREIIVIDPDTLHVIREESSKM